MNKTIFTFVGIALYLISCSDDPTNGKQDGVNINSIEQLNSGEPQSPRIDFSNLEQYYSSDSLFSFVAPRGFFVSTRDGLKSIDSDFEIQTQTFAQNYPCDPEEEILSVKSLQEKFMKGISVTYKTAKTDFFVVSGLDQQDRIVYVKGDYTEFYSMRGREEGEPSLVWSKAGVIRFTYPQSKKKDFNRVVEIISNSLKVNHDLI